MPQYLRSLSSGLLLFGISNPLLAKIAMDIRPAATREWNDEASTGKPDTGQFEVNYARIKFSSQIDETLSLKLYYAFHSVNEVDRVTGISNAVSEASLTGKISDALSIILGKQWAYQGGWEGDYAPYAVYWYSPSSSYMSYVITGLSLKAKVSDFLFNIMVFNPGSNTTGDTKYEGDARQKKLGAGLNFMGNENAVLRPLLQYHLAPNSNKDGNNIHFTAGLQINLAPVKIEYDSMHSVMQSYSTAGKNDENHGNVIKLEYMHENLRSSIKYFDNAKTLSGVKLEKSVGGTLALEYLLGENISHWFFLAYTQLKGSAQTEGGLSRNISELTAGVVARDVLVH